MNLFELIKYKLYYFNFILIAFSFLIIVFYSSAQDNVPEFPYDPEEKAAEAKMCAKICLRIISKYKNKLTLSINR